MHVCRNIGNVAMHILPFSTTYMSKSGFSVLASVKTKAQNRLNCEAKMRCALSSAKPGMKLPVS